MMQYGCFLDIAQARKMGQGMALFVFLFLLLFSTFVHANPSVAFSGDLDVSQQVAGILAQHGIQESTGSEPQGYLAQLQDDGQHILVRITGPDGQSNQRNVNTPQAAAAWIESVLRSDLSDPLLIPRARPNLRMADAVPPNTSNDASSSQREAQRFHMGIDGNTALGSDASVAAGVGISGCYRLGNTCVGARIRFLDQISAAQGDLSEADPGTRASIQRSYADVQVTAGKAYDVSRLGLAPAVGFGLRWLDGESVVDDDSDSRTALGISAGVSLEGTYFFANGLALVGGIEGQALLGRPLDKFTHDKVRFDGLPRFTLLGSLGVRLYP